MAVCEENNVFWVKENKLMAVCKVNDLFNVK